MYFSNSVKAFWQSMTFSFVGYLFEKKYHHDIDENAFLELPKLGDSNKAHDGLIHRMCHSSDLSNWNIIFRLIVYYRTQFISFFLLGLVLTFIITLIPLLLINVLNLINDGIIETQTMILSITGLIFTIVVRSFLNAHLLLMSKRLFTVIKRGMTKAILTKVIQLGSKSLNERESGKIQQLVQKDSKMVAFYPILLIDFFFVVLQLLAFIGLLFWQLGNVAIYGVLSFIFIVVIQGILSGYMHEQLVAVRQLADSRLSLLSEVFDKFRLFRMSGLTNRFKSGVNKIRKKEVNHLFNSNLIESLIHMLVVSTPLLLSMITFSIYLWQGQSLSITKIFSVIALFSFLRGPIMMFSNIVFEMVGEHIALVRVKNFLNLKARYNSLNDDSLASGSIEILELKLIKNNQIILDNISVTIQPGELVAICGDTGCGKTALLNLIAGYDNQFSGIIKRQGTVVHIEHYMSLNNDTLRNNILFGSEYQEKSYAEVLGKCQLMIDLESLPLGDQTLVGEMGTKLSGGQLQRVILARMLYSKSDIMLFDNPMSAIDPIISRKIMLEAILPSKGMTRLIVTHDNEVIRSCDRILEFSNGKLHEVNFDQPKHYLKKETNKNNEVSVSKDIEEEFDEEEVQKGNVHWSLVREVISQTGKSGVLIFILLLMIMFEALRLGSEIYLATQSTMTNYSASDLLNDYLWLGFSSLIFLFVSQLILLTRIKNQTLSAHFNLLNRVFSAPMRFFDNTPTGRILNRFSVDIEACSGPLLFGMSVVVTISLSLLSLVIFVGWKIPLFLIVVVMIVFFYWRLQNNYRYTSRTIKRRISTIRSPLYSSVNETIRNAPASRLSNNEYSSLKKVMSHVDTNIQAEYTLDVITSWLVLRQGLLSALIIGSVSSLVVFSGELVLSSLAVTYAVISSQVIAMLIMELVHVEHNMNSAWRVAQFTVMDSENKSELSNKIDNKDTKIEVKELSFVYPNREYKALDNISFCIAPGEKVGICGRSGAGKSSIMNVLLGIYPHTSGDILFGNYDVSKANPAVRQQLITAISQTPLTYVGSLRDNLDPNNIQNDDAIFNVLEKVGLLARIKALPNNVDTSFELSKLSSGEIQLLVLGRVLLDDKPIIFMDEANSDLDTNYKMQATKTIYKNKPHSSILMIAHHLLPLMDMDKIVYLDKGQIIEQGNPKVLINNENSHFYKLFESQVKELDLKMATNSIVTA